MANEFWTSHLLEPKRTFKFKMQVGDITFFHVMSSGRPSFEIGVKEHDYLNHKFKFPGKITWSDFDVTIVEEITNGSMARLLSILEGSGYSWATKNSARQSDTFGPSDLNTISKRRAVEALGAGNGKGVLLSEIDSEGNVICEYELHNPWISKVTPNDYDYSSEDLSQIVLTLTYDYAEINTNA